MIETILALIPTYGLWVIFFTLALGSMAVPLPGSMLVIAAGSFAAAGDINLYEAMAAAYVGFLLGDQLAFRIAHMAGPGLLDRFRRSKRAGPMVGRGEEMLRKRGVLAVLISHTIISPMGPWINYLSGATRMKWLHFSVASIVGAALWVAAYCLTGYFFADRLTELAELANDGLGFAAAFAVAAGAGWWLRLSWKKYREKTAEHEAVKEADATTGNVATQGQEG
ncbi:DedA family protein [uncultured Cohaesibacter sp.]|uniref:DedA family protein n=1 Tax=uncultured Cohaesibacter sp. TaxID=1002546 RepID=UPI00292FEF7A|nr:DedA family protein [uncultured Cohaesibacter sp.]